MKDEELFESMDKLMNDVAQLSVDREIPVVAIVLIGANDEGQLRSAIIERTPSEELLRDAFRQLSEDLGSDEGIFNAIPPTSMQG